MSSHGVPRVSAAEGKSEQSRHKELQKIEAYRGLVDTVNSKIKSQDYSAASLALTSKLLTQNPEYYTIWNGRRKILNNQFYLTKSFKDGEISSKHESTRDTITSDLHFLVPLLMQFPKCYWIWNHRIWLLKQASALLPSPESQQIWEDELSLVTKMLARDARNFHGWSYRRFVVCSLESLTGTSRADSELAYTRRLVGTNLSNFSAWHSRGGLIARQLEEQGADDARRREVLNAEFDLIAQATGTDPYDQSLWFYHQFLVGTMRPGCPRRAIIVHTLTNGDRIVRLETEIENIREILEDTTDCKWVYQTLLQCAVMYLDAEGGNKAFSAAEMQEWLSQLQELDPLRRGRWQDLKRGLNI